MRSTASASSSAIDFAPAGVYEKRYAWPTIPCSVSRSTSKSGTVRITVTLVPSAIFRGALTARVATLRTVRAVGTGGVTRLIGSKGNCYSRPPPELSTFFTLRPSPSTVNSKETRHSLQGTGYAHVIRLYRSVREGCHEDAEASRPGHCRLFSHTDDQR